MFHIKAPAAQCHLLIFFFHHEWNFHIKIYSLVFISCISTIVRQEAKQVSHNRDERWKEEENLIVNCQVHREIWETIDVDIFLLYTMLRFCVFVINNLTPPPLAHAREKIFFILWNEKAQKKHEGEKISCWHQLRKWRQELRNLLFVKSWKLCDAADLRENFFIATHASITDIKMSEDELKPVFFFFFFYMTHQLPSFLHVGTIVSRRPSLIFGPSFIDAATARIFFYSGR